MEKFRGAYRSIICIAGEVRACFYKFSSYVLICEENLHPRVFRCKDRRGILSFSAESVCSLVFPSKNFVLNFSSATRSVKWIMTDFGRKKIEEAKKNGQWDAPDLMTLSEEHIAQLSALLERFILSLKRVFSTFNYVLFFICNNYCF